MSSLLNYVLIICFKLCTCQRNLTSHRPEPLYAVSVIVNEIIKGATYIFRLNKSVASQKKPNKCFSGISVHLHESPGNWINSST